MDAYSPFHNEKNEFLSINDVTYAELSQLSVLDEGYHLEFKLNLNDSVKKKIPAIMTSFANSSGGWIVIGIEDKSKSIIPIKKERNDFGQIISQLLKGCVTPIPQYDVRFLECTDNTNMGVLLIYVYEGNFTPYVSEGTVYIRNGSSKEPVQRADRATIELLLNKSNQHKKSIEMFFKRDMCFPFCDKIHRIRGYSLCNIYLKNIMTIDFFKTNQEKVNIKDYIIKENNIFHSVQFGFDSILFRQDEITPFCNSMTTLYELYENFSAKIHIPLPQIGWKNKDNVRDKINEIFSDFIDTQAKYEIIDGVESLNFITQTSHLNKCLCTLKIQ